jgi:tRNA A37 threonylcarbamoyladenosine synthetase subunit TsaC/SUA5/YrdC
VPSKDWIQENLVCRKSFDKWFGKLPGPYTLIMKVKDARCVSRELLAGQKNLGVRIPSNWFSGVVAEANLPVVTTSVNVSGQKPIYSLKEIPESIKNVVDFMIEDGVIKGKPSTIVNLTKSPPEIIERK